MLKRFGAFALLVTTASAMAIAGPGGTKGKPDKGGDDDDGGGAFVPSWIYTDSLGGNRGHAIKLANEDFTVTRIAGPSGWRIEDLAHDPNRGRILLRDDRSIVEMLYTINPSGSVDTDAISVWFERIHPEDSAFPQSGMCVGLSDAGPGNYAFKILSTAGEPNSTFDEALNQRDVNGQNEERIADGFYTACTYLPGTDTSVAALREGSQTTIMAFPNDTAPQNLGTMPYYVTRIDVAENAGAYRFLISGDGNVTEWEAGEDITANTPVETNAEAGSYVCDVGDDGWPAGTVYRWSDGNSRKWIERTNTRRQIGGRKATWVQLQPVC